MGARRRQRMTGKPVPSLEVINRHNQHMGETFFDIQEERRRQQAAQALAKRKKKEAALNDPAGIRMLVLYEEEVA